MTIEVTNNAFRRVQELTQTVNDQNLVLRISVEGGGCSGFMYNYELLPDTTITGDDYLMKQNGGIIVIDSISQNLMKDCVIDFIETLDGSYFEIRNPGAKAKCGCGNSFAV